MSLLTLKNQMQKCNICDYNFLGGVVCFHPQCYEIKQVMCQSNKMFIEVLNKFWVALQTSKDIKYINS